MQADIGKFVRDGMNLAETLPHNLSSQHYIALCGALEGNLDMMTAAHALAAGATLVTHDCVFQRVKHLKIEDWTLAR